MVYLQYSPRVEDTHCVTYGLNNWMKAGVKPNMVISILSVHCLNNIFPHHLQNEECLPLLTVPNRCWHQYGLVDTSDWIAVLCGVLYRVAALHQVPCFHNHMTKTIIWGPLYGFKSKRLIRMNLLHWNTDDISHLLLLTWPGITSHVTSDS